MTFLVFYLVVFSAAIYKINTSYCAERECATAFSSWCCPFSSTCGSVGVCNSTIATVRDLRCPGQQACYSYPYYWCCDSDQTCGGYATCKGGSTYDTLMILRYVGIGFSVLAICLGLCACIKRHQRQLKNRNQLVLTARNQGVRVHPYSVTNMGRPTLPNPLQQSFTISGGSGQVPDNQQVPPAYHSLVLPSIGKDESKI